MKYKKLTGVILKKQNYKEADQIITVWSKEAGKLRLLARGLRLPKSKLAYAVSDLSVAELDLAGRGSLMTLIGAKPIRQFQALYSDLHKTAAAFYAAELVLKMTADESPCPAVFNLLLEFLGQLEKDEKLADYGLIDAFAVEVARELGFGSPTGAANHRQVKNFVQDLIERELQTEKFLTELTLSA